LGHKLTALGDIFDKIIYDTIAKVPNDFAHYQENLVDWCNINTGSRNYLGLKSFLPHLEDAFSPLPGTISRKELVPEKVVLANGMIEEVDLGHSFHLKVRPDAPIQIVLTGHYDTVFPIDSTFQKVTPSDSDELNGPGVADMKGGILVMLEGLKAFEHYEFKNNIGYEVLLSPDEEIGSLGSAHLLHEIGTHSDLGLTYEPALPDGSMAGARKGSANFALIIHGKSAHVGRAHSEGISAILAAAKFVTAFEDNNDNTNGVTFNCGKIDGGSANNVVPDMAIVRFNIRAPSPETMDWAVGIIHNNIAAISSNGIHCHLEGGISRPPKPKNKAQEQIMSDISRVAAGLGISMQFKDTGGVCEGNNLFASGCPNIDTLGVLGGNIHSSDEYVLKSSFGKRAALTTAILCTYASGKLDAKALRKLM
jgi:glutamate carboxypeptidase